MIDTSNWKHFKIGELFIVSRGQRHVVGNHEEGDLPYYSASLDNNGVTDYISNPLFVDNDAIVVTTFGDAFYAKGDFTASDEITILHHEKLKELNGLFIASTIRRNKWKYSFKVKAFKERVSNDSISLPVTSDGQPDWAYMESYMKQVIKESEKSLEKLKSVDGTKRLIDVSGWGEFAIADLFELSLPKGDLQVIKVEEGEVLLITPSNFNNGLLKRISSDSKSTLFDANSITVDMFGNTYYQDEEFFVTAHGHVNVLIPTIQLNMYSGAFLASAIRAMFLDKYGFSEMCTLKALKSEKIKLPIDANGEPDWDYMESYMKTIMENAELKMGYLNSSVC